jgi:hypothetical protein
MNIRYRPPVLLSQLLSRKIFSCEAIKSMMAQSEMWVSLITHIFGLSIISWAHPHFADFSKVR